MVWRLIAERVAAADGANHGARLARFARWPQLIARCCSGTRALCLVAQRGVKRPRSGSRSFERER